MKIFGIIAEFNPLHNGHLYLIEKAREAGADHIVAILSGSLVQRGEFSKISKWARAKTAIECGVDLVIELPAIYSCASAPYFAFGAVEILHKLSCITHLAFGSESGDIELLNTVSSRIFLDDSSDMVKKALGEGMSFAKALGSVYNLLPNDILASNYLCAIKKLKSDIVPCAIKRIEVAHDSKNSTANFSSASLIREKIEDSDNFQNFVPNRSFDIIEDEISTGKTIDKKSLFLAITSSILCKTPEELREILDIAEGIEYRIIDACKTATDYDDLIFKIKTKRYTLARIRRTLLYILIGIKKGVYNNEQSAARILAFGSGGSEILKRSSKEFPLSSSAVKLEEIDPRYRYESIASDFFSLLCKIPSPRSENYTNPPIKITNN